MTPRAARPATEVIEVRVSDLRRLFKAIDPSPFYEQDLDDDAEAFILDWARDLPHDAALSLLVHVGSPVALGDEDRLRTAVHAHFARATARSARRLRTLLATGRKSLLIGVLFVAAVVAAADLMARTLPDSRLVTVLRESLVIGAWVALWRPLEIFLYDWWPIRAERRLHQRLAAMPVALRAPVSP